VLTIRGLHKAYKGVPALRGVDLDVEAGEVVGLLGPNGAGKTTLVSIVVGLRHPDEGTVTVNGIDAVRHPEQARPHIGLAPQELGYYPTLTVRQNLSYFGELGGLRRRALSDRIGEVADAIGLTDMLGKRAALLSGGQKRRLHTAMALLHRPDLLLLDEPTAGADVATRTQLLHLVKKMAADGAAVVYSTHYLPEVEELGASVAILESGVIVARGTCDQLLAANAHAAVELVFDGEPPPIRIDPTIGRIVPAEAGLLRIQTAHPETTTATVLAELGEAAKRLRSVEIVRPSLESVYLAVTGRRYSEEDAYVES
jgi:ABC-2 type transport system ATP-binding protein